MINKSELNREIIQLFLAACNFMELAKKSYAKLDSTYKGMTVKELAYKFEGEEFSNDDEEALFMLSYLSSSAIRISTILEIIGLKPTSAVLYRNIIKSKNNIDYLCHYLRDNVCHEEPSPGDYREVRQYYLDKLKLSVILENICKQIGVCFEEIIKLKTILEGIEKSKKLIERIKKVTS
jgi:hypothetical protein